MKLAHLVEIQPNMKSKKALSNLSKVTKGLNV